MTRLRSLLSLALLLLVQVWAIEVTPGSDCAAYCLDDSEGDAFDPDASTTSTSDIVCQDVDFTTKSAGIKFKNCQDCLQKSKHTNGTESDMHWFMYNLRYSLSTCLFDKPKKAKTTINSPCIIDYACRPLEDALASDLKPSIDKTWGYCDKGKGEFGHDKLDPCISCLEATTDQSYLANFVSALGAGCEQKPDPGAIVRLSDTVFTTSTINGTTDEDIRDRPAGASSSTLTTGAIVGIAVGAGLLLFGGLALFCVYWRRQKKYEATEKKGGDFFPGDHGTYTPDPFLPPQANQMTSSLRHMSSESGAGAAGGHSKGPSVMSAEYYDKGDMEMQHANYNFDPRSTNRGPNGALPSHPAYIPRAVSRHPESKAVGADRIAVQAVPAPPPAATHHHQSKSLDAQSYSLHKYTPSTSSLRSTPNQPSPNPPIPPPPPPSRKPKVPSLVLPSVRRVRGPKKYSPPLVARSETPASLEQDPERAPAGINISQPVMGNDIRFQDMPLQGGQVLAREGVPVAKRPAGREQWDGVPMKSGKSALYGY